MSNTAIDSPEECLSLDDFLPLADFVESYPNVWRTMQSARWAINNRSRNGLDDFGVLSKRNGRISIILPRMAKWLAAGPVGGEK